MIEGNLLEAQLACRLPQVLPGHGVSQAAEVGFRGEVGQHDESVRAWLDELDAAEAPSP
jgi:hypothetical protein